MNIQRMPMLLALSFTVLSIAGCSDRIGMAEQSMTDIRNQPAQPIEPPPKAELVEGFTGALASYIAQLGWYTAPYGALGLIKHSIAVVAKPN